MLFKTILDGIMDNYNFHILVDAKTEFTKQLCNILTPRILEGISSMYDIAVDVCDKHNDTTQYLRKFQTLLEQIPKWSQEIIDKEHSRIKKKAECEWIDDLINAVFVSHVKVMAAIKVGKKAKDSIDIKVPNSSFFIHKAYIEVARRIWKKPYVFFHKVSSIDYQRGLGEAENIIDMGIQETIRSLLPVKAILKEYLGNNFEDEDLNDDDISKAISTQTKNNLRKIVQQELANYKSSSESVRSIATNNAEMVHIDMNTPLPKFVEPLGKQEPEPLSVIKVEPEPLVKQEPEPIKESDIKEVDLTIDIKPNIKSVEKTKTEDLYDDLAINIDDIDMKEIDDILALETKLPISSQVIRSGKDEEFAFFDDI